MNKLLTYLCPIKVGEFANWKSQGFLQWEQPKRVVHVSHYKWLEFYAYFDGSMTGIPVSQLIKE